MGNSDSTIIQSEREIRDTLGLLDAFLVDNEELALLNARLSSFNLFDVLRIDWAEIRHSNMLAWLLTPGETHGLGDAFLRRFISKLLIQNQDVETTLTPAKVELMRIEDVEVLREWHNIDILVHGQSPVGRWGLIIENKLGARESGDQLQKYKDDIDREFHGVSFIPVFLSLEGEEPSVGGKEAGYVSISHSQVLEIVERVVEQNRSRIPSDATVLIDHYLTTLRRLTMSDKELVDLCKEIYRKHKKAIDLIVSYGSTSQVLDACEEKAKELVGAERVSRSGKYVLITPKEMALFETKMSIGWWSKYPIIWWFYYHNQSGEVQLVMEVGPVADYELRTRLLNELKEAGLKFREKAAYRKESKYTRVISIFHKLKSKQGNGEPDDDPNYVKQECGDLWEKGWSKGKKVVEILNKCNPTTPGFPTG